MSYSSKTMQAFSAALGAVHAAGSADAAVAASSAALPADAATAPADLAFLHGLLATHVAARRAAFDQPPPISIRETTPADFNRLRGCGLTARECEVAFWVAQGERDAAIAAHLGCAPRTVGKHIEHLLAKLGGETRLAAAANAQEWLRRHA